MELIGQLILFVMIIATVWASFSWIGVNNDGTPMGSAGRKIRSKKPKTKTHSHKR